MGRRRRGSGPAGLFDEPIRALTLLEENYLRAMVPCATTEAEFLSMMFDDETLDKLRWAFLATEQLSYYARHSTVTLVVEGRKVPVTFSANDMGIATPSSALLGKGGVTRQDGFIPSGSLSDTISKICDIDGGFRKVAGVLQTFNTAKWSLGAALHYLPGVRALFPQAHAVNQISGSSTFREPQNVGPLLASLRAAQATLTDALLMPTDSIPDKKTKVAVALPSITLGII